MLCCARTAHTTDSIAHNVDCIIRRHSCALTGDRGNELLCESCFGYYCCAGSEGLDDLRGIWGVLFVVIALGLEQLGAGVTDLQALPRAFASLFAGLCMRRWCQPTSRGVMGGTARRRWWQGTRLCLVCRTNCHLCQGSSVSSYGSAMGHARSTWICVELCTMVDFNGRFQQIWHTGLLQVRRGFGRPAARRGNRSGI